MYYSPLLCKSVPRSTSRAFEVKRERRDIKKPESRIHDHLVQRASNVIRPKQFGIEDKQGLGEHFEELSAMNRYDHPIHTTLPDSDPMWQMNLFAREACA